MPFSEVYPHYVTKVQKKGKTISELHEVIFWLTGYTETELKHHLASKTNFENFFAQAPLLNPNVTKITGVICGDRIESIEDDLVRKTRYLDKLVDEIAKGRPMEKILRK